MTGASKSSASETCAWLVPAITLVGLYAVGRGTDWFGINAFRTVMPGVTPLVVALAVTAAAAAVAVGPRYWPGWVDSYPLAAAVALAAAVVMFAGRSAFLNPDGLMFAPKFEAAVPVSGAFITHDEMLEFLVHSRVWAYSHRWWGWSVEWSYQVTSCVAGVAFVVLAFRLARRLAPAAPGLFLFGLFAAAYMQLFFGDVENYTLTAVMVAGYLLAAARYLRGDAPLSEPGVTLAVAMSFHLLAGWLLPSFCYLGYVSWRRTGGHGPLFRSAWMGAGVLALSVAVVHFYGAPIWSIGASHAGRALRLQGMFVTAWSASYYFEQANLLLLLCPAVLLVLPLAWWRRLVVDETGWFLAIAAAGMVVFQLVWKSQIGVYNDWNLYAIGALVLSVLIWRSAAQAATTPVRRVLAVAFAAVAALHSYAWIAANHVHGQ